MNTKDKEIIKILKQNGRLPYNEIGQKIGLSEGAVRKRIKTLTDLGIIKKFTIKMGIAEGTEAIALLTTNPLYPTQVVSKKILDIPNIETVFEVAGEYDIIAIISSINVKEVNECVEKIRRIEGVAKTNTMIVLRSG